jgi:Ca2+-transporting ATPase
MNDANPRGAGPAAYSIEGVAGLSETEARARLARDGYNELPSQRRRGALRIALEVAREPMFLLLVAAGSLYLLMGELADALMLLGFVFVVMAITILQERRTERALDALRELASPRALVIRDGQARRIAGREVVRGDLLVVAEGDRIPADLLLRRCTHLTVDESLLTGESVPVRKRASEDATQIDRPGGDDLPSLYSGTLVSSGQGLCEVLHTGAATALGAIGKSLADIEPERSPLQLETARIVRALAIAGLCACALVVGVYALMHGGAWQAWKEGLLAGIALAMAILPEEFPVVLTVFLALGAWRIARSRVLTRRMSAIETLGAATVLCVDKTGTLTENRMSLSQVALDGEIMAPAADGRWPTTCAALIDTAVLASREDPFDAMERALHAAARKPAQVAAAWQLVHEYPLAPGLLAMSQVWQDPASGALQVASKGAPEAIAELCGLDASKRAALLEAAGRLAAAGLRVLGIARARLPRQRDPTQPHWPAQQRELRLEYQGLVAFSDPVRADVPGAVAECRGAGIRVVMITGDYALTARSIARQAGLDRPEAVMSGEALARLSDDELAACIGDIDVFARVVPEQKLRIVMALRRRGEVVAMTGDGVNDAPALKAAHIGIAMGGRGTDVAREAAALVLLDDDFSSIVKAVRLGRRIYDNIRKAVGFILAVHVPIAGLSMIPVMIPGWPLLLLPVHIVFLELIIDPACTLVFEAEGADANIMRRAPRSPLARLFSVPIVGIALLQGLAVLLVCLAIFAATHGAQGADAARAMVFAGLVASLLMIILINRSWTRSALAMLKEPNAAVWWVIAGAGACLALVLEVPRVQRLFSFAPLPAAELSLSLLAGMACLLWFEWLKTSWRWRKLQDGALARASSKSDTVAAASTERSRP